MAPMCEVKSSKARLHSHFHQQQHHNAKTKGETPTLLIESFSLQGHGRKMLPVIASNDLLPSITINNAKENVVQNGLSRLDGTLNAKDVYMNDLDAYRKDRRNGYYIPGERHFESRFARNLESTFNPRNTMYDRSNRKLRARSESEPHEIYTSASMISGTSSSGRSTPAWANREHMRDVSTCSSGQYICNFFYFPFKMINYGRIGLSYLWTDLYRTFTAIVLLFPEYRFPERQCSKYPVSPNSSLPRKNFDTHNCHNFIRSSYLHNMHRKDLIKFLLQQSAFVVSICYISSNRISWLLLTLPSIGHKTCSSANRVSNNESLS